MIERMPVNDIRPAWSNPLGDRYVSHADLRFALIQLMDDPGHVYVVTDQCLPAGIVHARDMVAQWREANAINEE
jgi:hypothetical protein